MTVANDKVAKHFANSDITEKSELASKTLTANGSTAWSYSTVIAQKLDNGIILLSRNTMTPTTSRHLSELRCALGYYNTNVVEVPMQMYSSRISINDIKQSFTEDLKYHLKYPQGLSRRENRTALRQLWKDALDFDSKVEPFLDDTMKVQIGRLIGTMKQD